MIIRTYPLGDSIHFPPALTPDNDTLSDEDPKGLEDQKGLKKTRADQELGGTLGGTVNNLITDKTS